MICFYIPLKEKSDLKKLWPFQKVLLTIYNHQPGYQIKAGFILLVLNIKIIPQHLQWQNGVHISPATLAMKDLAGHWFGVDQ